jgi:hypothetical protein
MHLNSPFAAAVVVVDGAVVVVVIGRLEVVVVGADPLPHSVTTTRSNATSAVVTSRWLSMLMKTGLPASAAEATNDAVAVVQAARAPLLALLVMLASGAAPPETDLE